MNDELSLVPAERLGALLTDHRTRQGLTIEEMHVRSAVGFSPDELRRIEQGQLALTDSQINRLLRAYNAGAGPIVPERTDLVIDLGTGAMFAGRRTKLLPEVDDVDDILGRYLSLLYLIRGLEPGGAVALRGPDLDVLSAALERSITEIEGRLFELMLPGEVTPWFRTLRHRLAVPAAGIVVGLTAVGTLVFVQFPKGDRPALPSDPAGNAAGATAPSGPVTLATSGTNEPASAAPEAAPAAPELEPELAPAVAVARAGVQAQPATFEPGTPESLGEAAEALIGYPFRQHLSDWSIAYEGPREGYRGNTNTVTRTITVHVGEHDAPHDVAGVLAHEVGHALDVLYLDDEDRNRWLEARGIEAAWWPDSGSADFHLGAGDFAEAVAVLLAASPSDSSLGPFTAAQLALAEQLLP